MIALWNMEWKDPLILILYNFLISSYKEENIF